MTAPPVSNEIVNELRNELVVMSAQFNTSDWKAITEEVHKKTNLASPLKVIVHTKWRALLDVQSADNKRMIISLRQIVVADCTVFFSGWSPGVDTLSGNFFCLMPRWVSFIGIPYHLLTYEKMESGNYL